MEVADPKDIERASSEALLIPFIVNVAPVVWLSGQHYEVEGVGPEFEQSLEKIRQKFQSLYPNTEWSGRISAARASNDVRAGESGIAIPSDNRAALLFSGGVDSLCAAVRGEVKQLLISIWGANISPNDNESWQVQRRNVENRANLLGCEATFVRSNL